MQLTDDDVLRLAAFWETGLGLLTMEDLIKKVIARADEIRRARLQRREM